MINKLVNTGNDEYKYKDENGISWHSRKEYLQSQVLDFCGCSDGDGVMKWVYDMIIKHVSCYEQNKCGYKPWEDNDANDFQLLFFLYWLNHKGFTEHGTTVRCPWLTKKGTALLESIEWCLKHEKE